MALRINTNVAALNAHRQLLGTETKLNSSMAKLSSGYRINNAGDDASGLVQANRMRADIRALNVASQNTVQGKSSLAIKEGTANQIESILERMKEISNKDATGSSTATNAEFLKLKDEINRIAAAGSTTASSTMTIQVGSDAETWSSVAVTVGAMDCTALGLTAVTTAGSVALTAVTTAIDTIGGVLGDIGAGMNRLEYTYSNLQVQIENYSASESAIRDVDMASEMVNFTKSQILLQAGTAMLAQANMSSQGVLSLFG